MIQNCAAFQTQTGDSKFVSRELKEQFKRCTLHYEVVKGMMREDVYKMFACQQNFEVGSGSGVLRK